MFLKMIINKVCAKNWVANKMKWGILPQRIVIKIFTQQLNEPWTPKDCYDLKVVSRFCLVLLWPVLILATDDSSGRLQDSTEVSDGIILFANVFSFPHHKLDSRPFETHAVNIEQDCIEICSQISRCRSLNFKHGAEESGEFDCHLLDNDKFNSSALFEKNPDFHHYSLAVSRWNPSITFFPFIFLRSI